MVTNKLFRECLAEIPQEQVEAFELSFAVAERLDAILAETGISQHELASRLGKRDSEVSKWLTGRHNFTLWTIAKIEHALKRKLIKV